MNDVALIPLKDLSEQLQEEVRRATADYIVPIVVNDVQIGSGTLVMIDDRPGILTAEHVVNASNKRFNLEQPNQHFRTAIAGFAHDLTIPEYVLRMVKTKNAVPEYGPDLAFISLPPGPFLSELKGRKSFYSLTGRKEEKLARAFADEGFFAVCGYPSIRNLEAVGEMGFSTTTVLWGYSFFTGPSGYLSRPPWDYYEMEVSRGPADEFERTFGGVSGGGVWRVRNET